MRLKFAYSFFLLVILALTASAIAQEGHPLTGTWYGDFGSSPTQRNDLTVVLTWDGKATNTVVAVVTNLVPVFMTNVVQVPVTNLVERPEATATIGAAGGIINTFAPGIGSIVALALGGLYHGYRQARNRRVNEALIQGVETARAVLTTTPQGQAADAQLVRWLMEHQKEAGVFATVAGLVDQLTDNPAAKMTAQEIAERVQRATQQRGAQVAAGS